MPWQTGGERDDGAPSPGSRLIDHRVASPGWVDQKTGVVRIPISRAMDLLLERGLPVRSNRPPEKANARKQPKANRAGGT